MPISVMTLAFCILFGFHYHTFNVLYVKIFSFSVCANVEYSLLAQQKSCNINYHRICVFWWRWGELNPFN